MAPNSVENIVVERGRREVGVVTIVGVGVIVGPLNYGVIRVWVGKWQVIVVVDMSAAGHRRRGQVCWPEVKQRAKG